MKKGAIVYITPHGCAWHIFPQELCCEYSAACLEKEAMCRKRTTDKRLQGALGASEAPGFSLVCLQ